MCEPFVTWLLLSLLLLMEKGDISARDNCPTVNGSKVLSMGLTSVGLQVIDNTVYIYIYIYMLFSILLYYCSELSTCVWKD